MAAPSSTPRKALSYWHRVRGQIDLCGHPQVAGLRLTLLSSVLAAARRVFLDTPGLEEKLPSGVLLSLSGSGRFTLKNVENLMRLREPAAWVAFGALVFNLVLALVGLATFEGPLVSLGWMWSERVANPTYLLCLAVLVSFCVLRERTPHARQLTLISLVVAVIAVFLGLTLALLGIGATAPLLAVLAAIVPQALSIIAVGLLIKLLQLQAVPRRLPPGVGLVTLDPELRNGERRPVTDSLAPSAAGQRLTWHPDPAAGAAWRTAVDAPAGVSATLWGSEAPTVRWQPISIPTPTNGSGPDGRMAGDPAVQLTVPMPEEQLTVPMPEEQLTVPMSEEQSAGRAADPGADQEYWNSQPLALDWSASPQS